jgi:hypothetical protein
MNTLIGMPEPATVNLVELSPAQRWWAGRMYWVVGPLLVVLAVLATVAATVQLSADRTVRLGTDPDFLHDPVIVSTAKPEFSSAALYLDEEKADVTILSVTPLTTANVQYIGARSIWPSGLAHYGNWQVPGRGFPRPQVKDSHAITETIPAAEAGYVDGFGHHKWVILEAGFRLTSGDVGAINGIEVVYRAGDRLVHKVYRSAVLVCFQTEKCEDDNLQRLGEDTLAALGLIRA